MENEHIQIFNEDCTKPTNILQDSSVDLGIFDPPFGIGESRFDRHYKRKYENVLVGYVEAPPNYDHWTYLWMTQAKRVLKTTGSMYIIIGHSNLRSVLNAAYKLNLHEINHIIWKYNFGVYTKKKYVTSHYHILYYGKSKSTKFNTYCRYGSQEKDKNNGSLLYQDLEDVFYIKKEYSPGKAKNQNKLPEALVNKLILYSSEEGDMICDFFMGNFTTAYCALKLGRTVCGYEINKTSFEHHYEKLNKINYGECLHQLKQVVNIVPKNQHKKISNKERKKITNEYNRLLSEGNTKKRSRELLQEKYGRGRFSIYNITGGKSNE